MAQPRMTVPPRREELQRDYTGAAMAADMARKVAERFNDMADNANLAKSYKVAQRYWEEGGHAFVDAARHREEELRLRKEEVYLYDHLDDDWMRTELRNAINYTRRRIIRLREEADLTRIRSELAFLDADVIRCDAEVRMLEKQIIEEDLHGKTKGYTGRPTVSFGSNWGDEGARRPRINHYQEFNFRRLQWFRKQISYHKNRIESFSDQRKRWIQDWERLSEARREREPGWRRLDEAARRHSRRLPPLDYTEIDKQNRIAQQLRQEQRRRQTEETQQSQGSADAEEMSQWEDGFDAALEEDPSFIIHPNAQNADLEDATRLYGDLNLGSDATEVPVCSWDDAPVTDSKPDEAGWGMPAQERENSTQAGWAAAFTAEGLTPEVKVKEEEPEDGTNAWELQYSQEETSAAAKKTAIEISYSDDEEIEVK